MSGALTIQIEARPLDQIEAELAVVGSFSDERPLRGATGRADWRLCGLVSDLLASEHLTGERGQVLLTPSQGRLRAERVLWLGLGARGRFRPASLRKISAEAMVRSAGLGIRNLAMAPLGFSPEDFPGHAEDLLSGVALGTRQSGQRIRLTLSLPPAQADRAFQALHSLGEIPETRDLALIITPPSSRIPEGRFLNDVTSPPLSRTHRY